MTMEMKTKEELVKMNHEELENMVLDLQKRIAERDESVQYWVGAADRAAAEKAAIVAAVKGLANLIH